MRQGLTVTGYVEPGPRSNKWYASVARARSQESVVSGQNGTFAIPGVPVTGGANALTVTVTDVSGNIATQVVNVTVMSGQPVSIGYDANGNQTTHNGWAMTYDRENRLASASSASLAVSYHYDALGRLIERIAVNSTNRLYYAGWQLIAEYDGTGALQKKYVYGPGIDEPVRMTSGGVNYYYHADGLGSVTEITSSTGQLVESYRYDVYGGPTILAPDSRLLTSSAIGNRLLFTGRDYDLDTGWYNYRYRYYNPALGRFVQPDPIRTKSGWNLYRYCRNNPVNASDPRGLCESNFWTLWGNSLNNTADAVQMSFGGLLNDLWSTITLNPTWSNDIYDEAASLLWSTARPAAPEATPYVATGLGISAAAATVAGGAMIWEWATTETVIITRATPGESTSRGQV
jgi:RHS repeat-associated protein